ncbi:MAG: hypothetical protein H6552_00435 [Chitinophagales bacterium]|nr:hypothetical protein [Chitinophagales bacterium]
MQNYNYTPVTNTYKINNHFKACREEPLVIIQGSQGASKTVSILMLIVSWFRDNPHLEITICSSERTKLMDTAFQDFKKICIDWNIQNELKWNGQISKITHNNSNIGFIEFIGLDKADIGKGRRRDLIYINECNKITHQKYFDITQRAKKVVVDFNPDRKFYIHDLQNSKNFIKLDYTGNEKLSHQEIRNILEYKRKGYLLDDNDDYILQNGSPVILNEFYANKWRVYGLGEIGGVEGRIYQWKSCTLKEYLEFDATEIIGVDWGKVDPFAVIGVKYKDGILRVHEYNYHSENHWLQNQSEISDTQKDYDLRLIPHIFNKIGIKKNRLIICDNNYKSKINALRASGWVYATKTSKILKIIERISKVQELDIYYTENSKNIENEQYESCWKKDRAGISLEEREDANNHTLDAIEYVVEDLIRKRIIKI